MKIKIKRAMNYHLCHNKHNAGSKNMQERETYLQNLEEL